MSMLDLVVEEIKTLLNTKAPIMNNEEADCDDEFSFLKDVKPNIDTSWLSEFE